MSKKPHVDEDVDDLDDILDEFQAPPPGQSAQKLPHAPSASTSSIPAQRSSSTSQPSADDKFNSDFAEEFARQMEAALRGLGGDPSAGPSANAENASSGIDEEQEDAFKKAWEKLLVDGMNAADDGKGTGASDAPNKEDPFQKNVREAMERLKASDANAQASSAAGGDDDLQKLLDSLGDANVDEDLHGILEGMMGQLMSKEVLYDPLKELNDKFPQYMQENAGKIADADKTRYEAQMATVAKIITIFDDPKYTDDDPEKSAEIVGLMSEMQSHGSPPEELMGPLPPGVNFTPDGMPKLTEDCKMQ